MLALAGTSLGVLVAKAAMALLASYDLPGALPIASLDLTLDARVLLFTGVLLAVTGLVGLIPALGATRRIADGTANRTAGESTGTARGQGLLLATQVAVTAVLLVGAGLFIRSLQNGLDLELGLSSQSVVMAQLVPALERYPPARTLAVVDEALSRLRGLPDVERPRPQATAASGGQGLRAQEIGVLLAAALRRDSIRNEHGHHPLLRRAPHWDPRGPPVQRWRSGRHSAGRHHQPTRWRAAICAGRDPIGTQIRSPSFPESRFGSSALRRT